MYKLCVNPRVHKGHINPEIQGHFSEHLGRGIYEGLFVREGEMANIAQMINVLQAVILTDGERMIKTPTYHVFNMYKYHQDAELLDSYVETKKIGLVDEYMVPNLTESVSLGTDGKIHATITNLSCEEDYDINISVADTDLKSVTGENVGGKIHLHNTFDEPENVVVRKFDEVKLLEKGEATLSIPASSVIHLAFEI